LGNPGFASPSANPCHVPPAISGGALKISGCSSCPCRRSRVNALGVEPLLRVRSLQSVRSVIDADNPSNPRWLHSCVGRRITDGRELLPNVRFQVTRNSRTWKVARASILATRHDIIMCRGGGLSFPHVNINTKHYISICTARNQQIPHSKISYPQTKTKLITSLYPSPDTGKYRSHPKEK
jgi:hypothetical protein